MGIVPNTVSRSSRCWRQLTIDYGKGQVEKLHNSSLNLAVKVLDLLARRFVDFNAPGQVLSPVLPG